MDKSFILLQIRFLFSIVSQLVPNIEGSNNLVNESLYQVSECSPYLLIGSYMYDNSFFLSPTNFSSRFVTDVPGNSLIVIHFYIPCQTAPVFAAF